MARIHPRDWHDLECYDRDRDKIIVLKDFNLSFVSSEFNTLHEIFFYGIFHKFDVDILYKLENVLHRVIRERTQEINES